MRDRSVLYSVAYKTQNECTEHILFISRFMVKSNAPNTTTTRVICLTSSKSLTLTPSKSNSGTTNSGAPMIIQRKKGKIEYFSLGNKNQNSSGNNTTPKKSGQLNHRYAIKDPGNIQSQ